MAGDSSIIPERKATAASSGGGAGRLALPFRVRLQRGLYDLGANVAAERERWVLWAPVALAVGIAIYHALWLEPAPAIGLAAGALALVLGICAVRSHSLAVRTAGFAAALILTGFALAQAQTLRVEAPKLSRPAVSVVTGSIELVEPRDDGARLILRVQTLDPEPGPALERVRVTVREFGAGVKVGDVVRVRARLLPASGPAIPGGFDFARWAFFKGLGAVGYSLGDLERLDVASDSGAAAWIAETRRRIAAYTVDVLPGATGAVAAAMLTGLRGDIPDPVWDAMQRAGLAHLLAISGLHLGLVAGTAFLAVRYGFCLWPAFALRIPVHRVAAAAALLVAGLYLLLAGATVPTQRAFLMTAVVLLGTMLDREPLSLRLVALAACVVLAIDPVQLFGPSFQMSFAAVVALVAVYERWHLRGGDKAMSGGLIVVYLLGVLITTLIASAATTPFAAFHFGRVATYGTLANLIAVPAMAVWVMPMGLLCLLLMPFGLAGPALVAMGWGIDVILGAAAIAASWPYASLTVPQPADMAVWLVVAGGLWAAIWRGPLARLAVVPVVLAGLVLALQRPPDLVVAGTGDRLAFRQENGQYAVIADRPDRFVERSWWRVLGETRPARFDWLAPPPGWRCDALGCRFMEIPGDIAVSLRPNALLLDCDSAYVVNLATGARCLQTPTLSRDDLNVRGAASIWFGDVPIIRQVWPTGARRPWDAGG